MITLYTLPICPYCKRVKDKLAQLKLKYKEVTVDVDNWPDVLADYQTVPVLMDDDLIIGDSEEIIVHLNKKYNK